MKKTIVLLALMTLVFTSFVSAGNLVDGTYEAWSDAAARSINYAKIFVEDGEMVAVILREYTNLLVEKDFAVYPWEEAREAIQTLGAKFVATQSHEADIITAATGTSVGSIQAVERALMKANPDVELSNKYFDGVFFGRTHYSDRNYYEVAAVTIENDQVVNVEFTRYLADFSVQDLDEYDWPLQMAWNSYSDAAKDATPGYVDTITGATGVTDMGNIAVRDALDRASTK